MANKFDDYINEHLCFRCGGSCCKRAPGIYSPTDFESLKPKILADTIIARKIAIKLYCGDPRERGKMVGVFYLRPSRQNEDRFTEIFNTYPCIHLTENGCSLDRTIRPYQCLALKPGVKDGKTYCNPVKEDKASQSDMVIRWINYQKKVKKTLKILSDRGFIKPSQLKTMLDNVEP